MHKLIGFCGLRRHFRVRRLLTMTSSRRAYAGPTGHGAFPCLALPSAGDIFKGVALLHSFWYEGGETFRDVEQQDPKCAMAHWGMAMSLWHQLWNHPNAATIKRASAELKAADKAKAPTERERDYSRRWKRSFPIARRRIRRARGGVLRSHGEGLREVSRDHEAAAFYALSLLGRSRMTIPHSSTGRSGRDSGEAVCLGAQPSGLRII